MTRKYDEKGYCVEGVGSEGTGALIFCAVLCALLLSVFCFFAGYVLGTEQVRSAAEKADVGEFYLDGRRTIKFRWKTVTPEKVSEP